MQYVAFIAGIVLSILAVWMSKKHKLFQKYNKYIVSVAVSFMIALFLEVFTFNFVSFEGNDGLQFGVHYNIDKEEASFDENNKIEAEPSDIIKVSSYHNGEKLIYEAEIVINSELKDLDTAVDSKENSTKYELYYMDEAIQKDYKRINMDGLTLIKGFPSSGHVKIHFAGKTSSIKLIFTSDSDSPISNIHVKINQPVAFDFNFFRFAVVFFIAMLAWIFSFTRNQMKMKKSLLMVVVALQMSFIILLFMATNASFDSTGKYAKEDFYETMDPYQELTLALAQGKVDLNGVNTDSIEKEQQGIEALEGLQNTYEWEQRDGIDYKWDRAFYNGKYYCYFGIVPVLLIYLPVYLLTGIMVKTKFLTLFFVLLSVICMAKLVMTLAGKWKKEINLWVVLGTIIAFVNASMVMFCINGSKFYEIATVSALVFALLGIDFILNAFTAKGIRKKMLLLGALFMALSVGCRPNYILASFIIAPVVLNGFAKNGGYHKDKNLKDNFHNYIKGIFHKNNVQAILSFVIPYIVIGIGLMIYNYIRFDSITEFGAKYQLTVYDTSYYHVTDFGKIPIMLSRGIFMLPRISSTFPFVSAVSESANYAGYFYGITYFGIMANPIMWLLFMMPWAIKRGVKQIGHKGIMISSLVIAIIMCYITTAVGGTSLRYSVDFAWIFFVPVIYIIFAIYTRAKERNLEKYALIGLGILILATVLMNVLVCISPSWSTIYRDVPEIFYRLEKIIVFWK